MDKHALIMNIPANNDESLDYKRGHRDARHRAAEIALSEDGHDQGADLLHGDIDPLICPGCGWTGQETQTHDGACPACGYENNGHDGPARLLTLSEMEASDGATWNDVDMNALLTVVLRLARTRADRS